MKHYKMDKWGQISIVEAEEGNGQWSVRAGFLILIPVTVAIVGAYLVLQYVVGN